MLGPLEIVLIAFVLAILVAAIAAAVHLARRKGRDPVLWGILVAIFLPSLLVVALLPAAAHAGRTSAP